MKKILITGGNGFIGSYLVQYFSERNYNVIALIHKAYKAALPNVEYRQFDLNSFGSDIIPKDVDTIIHTAYIPYSSGSNSDEINLMSTERLLDIARKKNIKNFIFLSSFSAKANAKSHYGKNKWAIQQLFDFEKELVLRPGLVLGNGGLFQDMYNMLRTQSLLPMIAGGKQELQTIYIEDLTQIIEQAIQHNIHGLHSVAEKKSTNLKSFNKEIAGLINRNIRFLSIPYFMADILFGTLDLFKIKTKIGKENYLGLKQMEYEKVCDSATIFNIELKKYNESLRLLIK